MDEMLKRGNVPENAALAFEGVRCRIYQWPQKMYDGSIATFEKIVRIPASTVIAVVDGKILIQEQEQPHREPFLSLSGGHADFWEEKLLDVAKRELLEESGLISEDWELVTDLSKRDFYIFEHHLYIARSCKKVAEPHLDNGEKITNKFVSLEEFKTVISDTKWRHPDITNYLNKSSNFDKLVKMVR